MWQCEMWIGRERILSLEIQAYRVCENGERYDFHIPPDVRPGEFRSDGAQIYQPMDSMDFYFDTIYLGQKKSAWCGKSKF